MLNKFFIFLFSISAITATTPNRLTRSVTLTPGYIERIFNSNEMMTHGPLSIMQLSTKVFDELIQATLNNYQWIIGLTYYVLPHSWLSFANNVVYHEFGHARAVASFGSNYSYNAASEDNIPTDYAYGIYVQKLLNPSKLFGGAYISIKGNRHLSKVPKLFFDRVMPQSLLQRTADKINYWLRNLTAKVVDNLSPVEELLIPDDFFNIHYTSLSQINSIISKLYSKQTLTSFERGIAYILAEDSCLYEQIGGLNNQMRYSQDIADLIFKHNGHLLYFNDYFDSKLSAFWYASTHNDLLNDNLFLAGNDIANILRAYSNRAWDISSLDIQRGSIASLLFSSTTWAFIYSGFMNTSKENFLTRPPVWQGWRLPDLNFYLTTQGLSLQVVTGYQFSDEWYAGLTAEMVYKGNKTYEFGPSLGYTLNFSHGKLDLSGQIIIGDSGEMGGHVSAEWTSVGNSWTLGVKYIYHNALTLVGERNIPFLTADLYNGNAPSTINHEANVTLSYNY